MHAGVELDVYGILLHPPCVQLVAESFQRIQVRDSRFEAVVYDFREEVGSGSEYEYWQGYAAAAKFHSFDGECYGQIIGAFSL